MQATPCKAVQRALSTQALPAHRLLLLQEEVFVGAQQESEVPSVAHRVEVAHELDAAHQKAADARARRPAVAVKQDL
eukprot:scaffold215780_cov22-Tisochrysis_lutea.AAC.1